MDLHIKHTRYIMSFETSSLTLHAKHLTFVFNADSVLTSLSKVYKACKHIIYSKMSENCRLNPYLRTIARERTIPHLQVYLIK